VWLLEEDFVSAASSSHAAPGAAPELRRVVALARVTWQFLPSTPASTAVAAEARQGADSGSLQTPPWGSVHYFLDERFELDRPVQVPGDVETDDALATLTLLALCRDVTLKGSMGTVGDFVDRYDVWFSRVMSFPHNEIQYHMCAQRRTLLYQVPLTVRMRRDALVPDFPPAALVKRWRTDLGVRRATARRCAAEPPGVPADVADKIMLELPPKGWEFHVGDSAPSGNRPPKLSKRTDPMRTVNAIAFALHLRSVDEFSEALDRAADYQEDPDMTPPERDRSRDHSRADIKRGKAKLDIVGMNMQRRKFHAEVAAGTLDCLACSATGRLSSARSCRAWWWMSCRKPVK